MGLVTLFLVKFHCFWGAFEAGFLKAAKRKEQSPLVAVFGGVLIAMKMRKKSISQVSVLITSGSRGWAEYYSEKGAMFFRMTNLRRGTTWLDVSQMQHVDLPSNVNEGRRASLKKGDVIVSVTADIGRVAVVRDEVNGEGYLSQHLSLIRPNQDYVDGRYLAYKLSSDKYQKHIKMLNDAGAKQGLSLKSISGIEIDFHEIKEQRVISNIIEKFDEYLNYGLSYSVSACKSISYFREALFHGTHRLPGFTDPWPMVSLGQVTRPLTARNKGQHGRDRVMGVTKADGLVPMREQAIAEEIGRYLRLPPGGFAYNPMRINIGSITMSELDEEVIVSPDYVVFECDRTRLDPRFLNHLRRTQVWADYMTIAGNGSVRVRIYYADLAGFEFHLPSLAEQARIVEVLDDAEQEIALLRAEKALREKQRDALATALLTGRLPIPESMLEAERMAAAMAEQGSIAP